MDLEAMRQSHASTVTIKDVATVMGVDVRTVSSELAVNGGTIPSIRIGRRIVVPRQRFLAYFDGIESPADERPKHTSEPDADPDALANVRAALIELLGTLERPRPAA